MGKCPKCGKPYYATISSLDSVLYVHNLKTSGGGLYIERAKGCNVKAKL